MHVVIRADGGAAIGLGHVTRCLALADRLRERGARVTFVTRDPSGVVFAKLATGGCDVAAVPEDADDLPMLLARARALDAAAVVTDVYGLTVAYQQAVRALARLVVIDDLAEGSFLADVVVNQNLGARAASYAVAPHTRLLLGPRFALLRREFVGPRGPAAPAPRVLIMMGGADPDNVTARALADVDTAAADVTIDVVAGPAFRDLARLASVAAKATHAVRIHHDPPDLPALMAAATLAVSAAGSTCWELCCLGVPAVLLVLADNQIGVAAGLEAAGAAESLGAVDPFPEGRLAHAVEALLADPARRAGMAEIGRGLVDGAGAERVAAEVLAA